MKNRLSAGAIWLTLVLLSTLSPPLSTAFAQGSLTPPGPPAPTMKTLDQVEPRTAIGPSSNSVTINSPGSYYLAGDIVVTNSNGVSINSGNVTLDLNGFAIRRPSTNVGSIAVDLNGLSDGSRRNVTIRNGHISGKFGTGIELDRIHNVRIEDLTIEGCATLGIRASPSDIKPNGITIRRCIVLGEPLLMTEDAVSTNAMTSFGLDLGQARAVLVENCVVGNLAGSGIRVVNGNSSDRNSSAIVRDSVFTRCGGRGIDLFVNTSTPQGVLIERCTVDRCGSDGMFVGSPATVRQCVAARNAGHGIVARRHVLLVDNQSYNNAVAGIFVEQGANRIEHNHVTSNGAGIDVAGTENLIIRNSAVNNTTNYVFVAGNSYGPLVVPASGAAISGNGAAAGSLGTTDPWANFTE